jgi:hypothetical protein
MAPSSKPAQSLQEKMNQVVQKRNAYLLGIRDENRRREKKREEVRNRKRTIHFQPPTDKSSLLGELPPITFVERNPTWRTVN